jgi:hypothetical protein
MNTHQIIEARPAAIVAAPSNPASVLVYAMEKGADMAQIEKLLELQMRWEADQARKAYVADMADFKKQPPTIVKDKLVQYSGTSYTHATLGNVTAAIVAGLAKHGFSHRWDTEQLGANIIVTCILTHKLGHSERTSLSSGKDDSGKKNNIQQMASAITYLQRYTLLAATGLATHDQGDDDGQSADGSAIDKLIADAARAPDLLALQEIWDMHSAFLRDTSEPDFTALKDAVNGRKAALEKRATPGKSSRLADIIGAQQEGGAA